jgi:hypothetical protein
MAGRTQEAWNEVGERFSAWGHLVAERYRESETADAEPEETQRKLEETARELADQVNRAFSALGDTLRDEQAKAGLKDAARSVGDAVAVTVGELTVAIRRRVGQSDEPTLNDPSPDDASPDHRSPDHRSPDDPGPMS